MIEKRKKFKTEFLVGGIFVFCDVVVINRASRGGNGN
jgi:hypothetical protein